MAQESTNGYFKFAKKEWQIHGLSPPVVNFYSTAARFDFTM